MQLWYYEIKIKKWKFFFSPIPGDSLKSMKKNEIIVIHSKKTFEIVYFLVAWVTFYNFQLSFLFADTMAPFKRYEELSELVKMYPCLYNTRKRFQKRWSKTESSRSSLEISRKRFCHSPRFLLFFFSENFSYPKAPFFLFVFVLTPSTST